MKKNWTIYLYEDDESEQPIDIWIIFNKTYQEAIKEVRKIVGPDDYNWTIEEKL
jgi:hypothetical protein